MIDVDFPEELCLFITDTIPSIEAAELLILLSRDPARQWKPEEIVYAMRPTVITESDVKKCLVLFLARGLLIQNQGACFQYQPASPELDSIVSALSRAYNQRPVTLIRMIYARKIQAFADAFKLKKD